MPLEVASFISELVPTNPDGADDKSQGDDHIRQLKQVLQNTFPNLGRAVNIAAQSWADKNFLVNLQDANYGMTAADNGGVLYFTCTAGARSYNLTAFASTPDGFCVFIDRDAGANNLSIVPNGTEQINSGGAGTALVLIARENGLLYKGATEWRFIASRHIASTSRAGDVTIGDEATFIAGTDTSKVYPSSVLKKHARERLYANRTYYVRTDGSDSNTGLVDSAGGAFLTFGKAKTVIQDSLDLNGFTVTVQVRDGSYTPSSGVNVLAFNGPVVGQSSPSQIVFQGNSGTPGNVIASSTAASCIVARNGAMFTIKDMELRTTTSGSCLALVDGSFVEFSGLRFGACANRHISCASRCLAYAIGNYSVVGAALRHYMATECAKIEVNGITVTITGTPAFSDQFARASNNGVIYAPGVTYSGSATGQRYNALQGGIIDTEGGGANYFPGNSAGAATSPGGYF